MLALLTLSVLLALLFAGAEAALLALSEEPHGRLRDPLPPRLERMLGDPEPLLHSLALGSVASVTLAGISLTLLALRSRGTGAGLVLAPLLLVPLVAVLTEIVPRLITRRLPGSFLAAILLPLAAFARASRPLALGGKWAAERISALAERVLVLEGATGRSGSEVNPRRAAPESFENEQEQMIDSVLEFGDTLVKEVMIPRRDMAALPVGTGLAQAVALARETQYSRIPVYKEKPENVVGVIHAKDLLPCAHGLDEEPFDLMRLARKPFYVPGVMTLDDLLAEFQIRGTHMAFVVDEFGSTAGLITLEDVLEEIFGDIQDEHDREEQAIRRVGRATWIVDGTAPIEAVEASLKLTLPESGCETIGGVVFQTLGHLPEPGETCTVEGLSMEVLRVEKRRVQEVRISAIGAKERWRSINLQQVDE